MENIKSRASVVFTSEDGAKSITVRASLFADQSIELVLSSEPPFSAATDLDEFHAQLCVLLTTAIASKSKNVDLSSLNPAEND